MEQLLDWLRTQRRDSTLLEFRTSLHLSAYLEGFERFAASVAK